MSKTTLKDIANHVGVSITTVSRVLNGQAEQHRIKKQTEEAILTAAKELGFSPYKSIFKPPMARSKTIGLIIPDISHFFLSHLARTIRLEIHQADYSVLIVDSREDTETEKESIDLLLRQNVDGLIILPVGKEWKHIQDVYNRGVPLVVVDRIMPELNCPSVGIDNYSGAREAMDYLVARGHTTIACIQRLPDSWINDERLRAYRDALNSKNIQIDESLIIGDTFGQKNGYLEGKLLLSRPKKPTAIFALSHVLTLGLLQVFREEKLHIPEDVSLISFDDLPFSEYFELKVTTVKQPVTEMGLMAVNLLLDQINSPGRSDPVHIKLRTTFIRRESVKNLPQNSPAGVGTPT
ncbi:LacI family transcriptional regulator [candidate division KSB1 bacterium]|nr:LacI family DNA-binding transcriptional regulator [candidate division KSB1 bacterium]RQW05563.1 MAG: LacI family transcriptional regulator [candidate division KSB1 bacterium]